MMFLRSYEIALDTEKMQHLHEEQQRTLADDLSSDEDVVGNPNSAYYNYWNMPIILNTSSNIQGTILFSAYTFDSR